MLRPAVVVALSFLCLAGGCFDASLADVFSVACRDGGDCVDDTVCLLGDDVGRQRCVRRDSACIDVADREARALPDGSACGDQGICVAAACVSPRCGDGVVTAPETCDGDDGCRANCSRCGDGVVDDGESCDNGAQNSDSESGACRTTCVAASCGDGVRDPGEGCDEGTLNSDSEPGACRTTCARAACGDGVVDDGEQCDDGVDNGDAADACRATCVVAACGDGVIDAGEACDNGSQNSAVGAGACRTTCVPALCGDGVRDPGEGCDDGTLNSDSEPGACRTTCARASCGDGVIDDGEQCDDGSDNGDAADACRVTCALAACGDGVLDTGEACDNGSQNSDVGAGACRTTCVPALCGDGVRDPGEGCDDGTLNSDSEPGACRTTCAPAQCGDGVVDDGEACDDGNAASGDGCRGDCLKVERCGDGVVDVGEACDDGNDNPRDGCIVVPEGGRDRCRAQSFATELLVVGAVEGRLAADTSVNRPSGLAVDLLGRIYVADTDNQRVLRINTDDTVVTVAGTGTARPLSAVAPAPGEGGPATSASLYFPSAVAVDARGRVIVHDDRIVRRVETDGTIRTISQNGAGQQGAPLAVDPRGALFARTASVGLAQIAEDGSAVPVASTSQVRAIAFDNSGRIYLADGQRVVRLAGPCSASSTCDAGTCSVPAGQDQGRCVEVIAGTGDAGFSGDNGPATSARLSNPGGVAVDALGRIVIADSQNHRIRRVDAQGNITTIAGTGVGLFAGDGGPAREASLNSPGSLVVDPQGRIVFVDTFNNVIRRIEADGTIRTVLGVGPPGFVNDGGAATSAVINDSSVTQFENVAIDDRGRVVFADTGNRLIRRINDDGSLTRIAGRIGTEFTGGGFGVGGFSGEGGPALDAGFEFPSGIAVDARGRIVVADAFNHCVRRIDTDGTIRTIAGGDGLLDRPDVGVTSPQWLCDLALFDDGVCDCGCGASDPDCFGLGVATPGVGVGHPVCDRCAESDGTPLPGGSGACSIPSGFSGDGGPATRATLRSPYGVAVDALGRVLIADTENHRVRRIDDAGVITTIAGTGVAGFSGDGDLASRATLNEPYGVFVDVDGNVLIADTQNNRIRRIGADGIITTVAGNGDVIASGDGGLATAAGLESPYGVTADRRGQLFVNGFASIRRVDASGIIDSIAGNDPDPTGCAVPGDAITCPTGDGGPAARALVVPSNITVDREGRVVFTDSVQRGLNTPGSIRRIESDGTLVTLAGRVDPIGPGPFARARLYPSAALAPLPSGALVSVGALGRALTIDVAARVVAVTVGYRAFVDARTLDDGSPASPAADGRARFAALLDDAAGVAFDPVATTLVITERALGDLRVIGLDPDGDGVIDDASAWTNRSIATELTGPAGIAYDGTSDTFVVVDEQEHCVQRIDREGGRSDVVVGRCGTAGLFPGFLNQPTHAVVSPTSGALYVADTGNHRVLRVDDDGAVALVIGDGSVSSAGEGSPARLFPVNAPRQLALDRFGNLYVASTTTVRLVANVDGDSDADGDDAVSTIFGGGERTAFPQSDAFCVRSLALGDDDAVYAADACQGFLVRLVPKAD
jgi:cysteine-rich repeat protein